LSQLSIAPRRTLSEVVMEHDTQGMLIAGGSFTSVRSAARIGDEDSLKALPTGSIAQWNETSQRWSRLAGLPATGMPGVIHCVAAGTSLLYVGGSLEMKHYRDDNPPDAGTKSQTEEAIRGVAAFNADLGIWSPLGRGLSNGFVYALALAPRDVYWAANDADYSSDVSRDTPPASANQHQPVSTGSSSPDMVLFAGGDFRMAGGHKAAGIAVWDVRKEAWHSIGVLDGAVYALAVLDGWVYAGGDFLVAGGSRDGSAVAADYVARWKNGVFLCCELVLSAHDGFCALFPREILYSSTHHTCLSDLTFNRTHRNLAQRGGRRWWASVFALIWARMHARWRPL
jgi:hypothetical protein